MPHLLTSIAQSHRDIRHLDTLRMGAKRAQRPKNSAFSEQEGTAVPHLTGSRKWGLGFQPPSDSSLRATLEGRSLNSLIPRPI